MFELYYNQEEFSH